MKNFIRKEIVLAVAIAIPSHAFSQVLEEIVVTAQKRAESLQDVPIAVSALSGDWMKQNNIANLEDVATLVPNLSLSGTPGVNTVRIRGLGTGGGNAAFEQSVGMYVDGIYAGRGYQFSLPYMDVERIEVLKGPQGVLFGKNSIAGAISITSAKPSEAFEAELGLSYELENDGYSVDAMINGELAPGLSGRFAASYIEENGWIENTLLDQDGEPEVAMGGYRASLSWDASDELQIYLKYDYSENDQTGSEMGIRHIAPGSVNPFMAGNPTWLSLYQAVDPDVGLIEDRRQSAGLNLTNGPDGYFKDVKSNNLTLQIDRSLGGHNLTLLSGYSTYEVDTFTDQSFSPLTILNQYNEERFDQFTQEIRLTSPEGEPFEYIVGAFYMDRSLDFPTRYTDINLAAVFGPTLPGAPLPSSFANATTLKQFEEDTRSISAFGQLTWNISDAFRASLGLRYSHEEKKVNGRQMLYELGTTSALNPMGVAVLGGLFGTTSHSVDDSRTEENVDPSLNIQWDITGDIMIYAAATKATKAGGYNVSDVTGIADRIEYDEEEAFGVEVGMKAEFLDNRLRFNSAVFHTEFTDLQVSVLDGASNTFLIGNAAEATSQGVELDVTYALSDVLTIGGSLAYLNGEFDEFPGAPCATSIYRQDDCVGVGPASSRDAGGDPMIHSPDWSSNLYIDYTTDFTENTILELRVDALYVDDFVYNLTYADPLAQDSYVKWNARLSLSSIDDRWALALVGKNLTDETTESFGGNTFLSPGVFFGNVDAPRQIFLNATWKFH